MDIRIGIANSPREINFESSQSSAEIEKIVATALDTDAKFVSLKDDKGKLYIVPTAALAYLEVGSEESRRIGFVA
ncbi:MAG TPA: DUF3107 domain-containing protein [Rhodoglobus sp.]|nr:DUF3107 domain-containing protein [Actinomycetota bacterium]HOB57314.1 DUF3107 domain-containing protein [Rhodoglobus sp.]HOT34235.1 DUF3107 domain-containing protein [Rhodoglobus sp.]HOW02108.1 DUF3107 domain-containing protein [Rhodoglobus sp.]HOY82792.1 DUF3107 domain-containing protein [Rhodoglobus sp.]